jgi:effector-binding domain-containing protein
MTYDVTNETVAARPTAVLSAQTTWAEYPALWGRLLGQVWEGVAWHGSGPKGRNIMLYRDLPPGGGAEVAVEVGAELNQPVTLADPITRSELPAGEVAWTLHRGPYQGLGQAYEALEAWCTRSGRTPAGVRWEVYGHHRDDPAELETEVYWLLT